MTFFLAVVLPVVDMPPFRWPECRHDIALAKEVVANRPYRPLDWESIAEALGGHFSTVERPVRLSGRACKDRLNLLLAKHKADDAKGLKRHVAVLRCVNMHVNPFQFLIRSGTEEDYTELMELLDDISSYMHDVFELKAKDKEEKKKKELDDKKKAMEMRKAAMEGMASKFSV